MTGPKPHNERPVAKVVAPRPTAARRALAVLVAAGCVCFSAQADVIVLKSGEEIAGAQPQIIRSATLYYLDGGELREIGVDEIAQIHFDGLAELDDAERFLARDDLSEALNRLLAAAAKTRTEPQRLWLHRRLAEAHDRMGDMIEACSHTGAVIAIDPDPMWINLRPKSPVNEPTWYSAAEAHANLLRAKRAAKDEALVAMVDQLLGVIEPLYEAQKALNPRLRYTPDSTISGILLRDLAAGQPVRNRPPEDVRPGNAPARPDNAQGTEPDRDVVVDAPPQPPPSAPEASASPDSPAAVDALLQGGRFDEALTACERIRSNPGTRDLAQFLHQFGLALAGAGRPHDAAVRFMQCATHYPGTPFAVRGLIETARLCVEKFGNEEAAMLLLDRAIDHAAALDDAELIQHAEQLLTRISADG